MTSALLYDASFGSGTIPAFLSSFYTRTSRATRAIRSIFIAHGYGLVTPNGAATLTGRWTSRVDRRRTSRGNRLTSMEGPNSSASPYKYTAANYATRTSRGCRYPKAIANFRCSRPTKSCYTAKRKVACTRSFTCNYGYFGCGDHGYWASGNGPTIRALLAALRRRVTAPLTEG